MEYRGYKIYMRHGTQVERVDAFRGARKRMSESYKKLDWWKTKYLIEFEPQLIAGNLHKNGNGMSFEDRLGNGEPYHCHILDPSKADIIEWIKSEIDQAIEDEKWDKDSGNFDETKYEFLNFSYNAEASPRVRFKKWSDPDHEHEGLDDVSGYQFAEVELATAMRI